jgi:hypothetical protein
MSVAGGVDGLYASCVVWALDERCLDTAAEAVVLLHDGSTVSIRLDDATRWSVVVTPELREVARVLLIETRDAFLAAYEARKAVQVAA